MGAFNFHYDDLQKATQHFAPNSLVAVGGFGSVYKGILDDTVAPGLPRVIAIKVSNGNPTSQRQFQRELELLQVHIHPRIIKLLGYCNIQHQKILVYEYMPNESLDKYLYDGDRLPWSVRRKIALHVAQAIQFLHSQQPPLIFRDIKTGNVLLDENYDAKLGDFGLVAQENNDGSDDYDRPMGTNGYGAPDYFKTKKLYRSADVYSFGVLLLELITGEKAHDDSRRGDDCFLLHRKSSFVHRGFQSELHVDRRINIDIKELGILLQIIRDCVSEDHEMRPPIDMIVDVLIRFNR